MLVTGTGCSVSTLSKDYAPDMNAITWPFSPGDVANVTQLGRDRN